MSATPKNNLGEIVAPYGRRIKLDEIAYESGLNMLRLTIREGARFTILEIDRPTAVEWGRMLTEWGSDQKAPTDT